MQFAREVTSQIGTIGFADRTVLAVVNPAKTRVRRDFHLDRERWKSDAHRQQLFNQRIRTRHRGRDGDRGIGNNTCQLGTGDRSAIIRENGGTGGTNEIGFRRRHLRR